MQSNFASDRTPPSPSPHFTCRGKAKACASVSAALAALVMQTACMQGEATSGPDEEADIVLTSAPLLSAPPPLPTPLFCDSIQSLKSYVIYAKSSVDLGQRVQVHDGNVGVHQTGATDPLLNVRNGVTISPANSAVAPSIRLAPNSSVGAIYVNGSPTIPAPMPPDVAGTFTPPPNPFPSNTPNLPMVGTVTYNDSNAFTATTGTTTLPSGVYGQVEVRAGATLTLDVTAPYSIRNLIVRTNGKLYARAPVTLEIAQTIETALGAEIRVDPGIESLTAKDFVIKTPQGPKFNSGVEVPGVELAQKVQFNALLIAPNALVRVRKSVIFTGAMAVDRVDVAGSNPTAMPPEPPGIFTYEDGIDSEPCSDLCPPVLTTMTKDTFFGTVSHLPGMPPAGHYLVKYEDGCMKYSARQWWSVNARLGMYSWFLVGEDEDEVIANMPGTEGFFPANPAPAPYLPGFKEFDDCVEANKLIAPIAIDHDGGRLGIWLKDSPYVDNAQTRGPGPTWSVSRIVNHGDICPDTGT